MKMIVWPAPTTISEVVVHLVFRDLLFNLRARECYEKPWLGDSDCNVDRK